MFTHPEYEKLKNLWKPRTPREVDLSDAFAVLFLTDAEKAGPTDWARQYDVSFADRVRLMDEFADIRPSRFIDVWNYQASFWKCI